MDETGAAMDSERIAGEWVSTGDGPEPRSAGARLEKTVPPVVVTAISIAGVLASLMQPRPQVPPLPALERQSACADCGVVLAVVPIEQTPDRGVAPPGPGKAP